MSTISICMLIILIGNIISVSVAMIAILLYRAPTIKFKDCAFVIHNILWSYLGVIKKPILILLDVIYNIICLPFSVCWLVGVSLMYFMNWCISCNPKKRRK